MGAVHGDDDVPVEEPRLHLRHLPGRAAGGAPYRTGRGRAHRRCVLLDAVPSCSRPATAVGTYFLSITVLLNSLQVFDIINVMTRGGPLGTGTTTMVYQVYQETFVNFRAGYGATVATVLFLVLLVVTVAQVRVMDRNAR